MDISNQFSSFTQQIAGLFKHEGQIPTPVILHVAATKIATFLSSVNLQVPAVDLTDIALARAFIVIALPPLFWNIIGPFEYYTNIPSKMTFKPIVGIYLCAILIASLCMYRDALFKEAINRQITLDAMDTPMFHALGIIVGCCGILAMGGAYYRLGITGTYMGDYFGVFQESRITSFPFNVLTHPMYDGSVLIHLAVSILERSATGLVLTAWVFFCYRLGCTIEEPFTAKMYEEYHKRMELEKGRKSN